MVALLGMVKNRRQGLGKVGGHGRAAFGIAACLGPFLPALSASFYNEVSSVASVPTAVMSYHLCVCGQVSLT